MRALSVVLTVVGGVAVFGLLLGSLAGAARIPARCAGGRFLVQQTPLVTGGEALVVAGQRVEIAAGCLDVRGVVTVGRRVTRLEAAWPRDACGDGSPPMRLRARFDDACGEIVGRLRSRGVAHEFVARRSICGDGVIDAAADEECEGGDFAGRTCPDGAGVRCMRCTDACRVELVPVPIGGGSGFLLSVHGTGRFAIMELDPEAYTRWQTGRQTVQEVRALIQTTSQFFADLFDFVVLVTDEDTVAPGTYHGMHYSVQNDTQGIGPQYDSTSRYGLWRRLQGVIHLSAQSGIRSGATLHELAHRWGNYVLPSVAQGNDAHWNFSDVGGQLGGWQAGTLRDLGDGLWQAQGPEGHLTFQPANGGSGVPYASLELYLMGLIGPEETTQAFHVADEAEWVDSTRGIFRADRIRTVALDDIVAQWGPRIPDVTTSQKAFRSLVIVLTTRPPSPARLALYDDDVRAFGTIGDDGIYLYNFWEATGGRATMQLDGLLGATRPAVTIAP
jgi:hypothetical protein